MAELAERLPEGAEEVVLGRRVSAARAHQRLRRRPRRLGRRPEAARRPAARLLRPARAPQADDRLGAARDPRRLRRAPSTWSCGERYREAHRECGRLAAELAELRERDGSRERDLDLYRYELSEIEAVAPDPGGARRDRRRARAPAPRRGPARGGGAALTPALAGADEDGGGAAAALAAGRGRCCRAPPGVDPALDALAERVAALAVELGDVAAELRDYARGDRGRPRVASPAVEERLEAIDRLERKHGGSVESVLAHAERCRERDRAARGRRGAQRRGRGGAGRGRSAARGAGREAERGPGEAAASRCRSGSPRSSSGWRCRARRSRSCSSRTPTASAPTGRETVELRVAPNPGIEPAPLRDAASGGELSRVMLALSGLGAGGGAGTLVFDEIDAGIGGNTARVVGERLRALGEERQVICITHLPQVASLADAHFRLEKDVDGERATRHGRAARRRGRGRGDPPHARRRSGATRPRRATPASCSPPPERLARCQAVNLTSVATASRRRLPALLSRRNGASRRTRRSTGPRGSGGGPSTWSSACGPATSRSSTTSTSTGSPPRS